MDYNTVIAERVLKDLTTNSYHINISDDGRFFINFICNDKKAYQVKFNLITSKGNQNELITHFIGSKIDAPVLHGALVQLSKRMLDSTIDAIEKELIAHGISAAPDRLFFKDYKLFGIQWHEGAMHATSEDDVKVFFSMCKNRTAFYATYPFDQYLRNYDRQYFNHLIIRHEEDIKPSHYASIDGDRIFGSTGWRRLELERDEFTCFSEPYHKSLYDIVDNNSFKIVRKYASNIRDIKDEEIDGLKKIMDQIYSDPKNEHDRIIDVLKYRKSEMMSSCDGSCFSGVKQKRLSSHASRI